MHGAFVIFIVVVFVSIAVAGILTGAKRRKALRQWAGKRGWRFSEGKDYTIESRYRFDCLCRGHSRYASNVCRGTWAQWDVLTFDYHYAEGSGKNRRSYDFSAVIVPSPVPLKPLLIRPENLFDKLAQAVGFDDIDFESAEFSRRFCVKAEDRRWAYDVIHQRTMEFLLSSPTFHIALGRQCIIAWRERRRMDVPSFEAALEVATGLLSRLPDYLVKQQMAE